MAAGEAAHLHGGCSRMGVHTRRRMGVLSVSNTVRSTRLLEAEGWIVDTVERWIPHTLHKRDLFGFIDLLAVHQGTGETMGIQTTSASNVSSRIHKMTASPHLPVLRKAGWRLECHGWAKKKGRWVCRREDVS